MNEVILLVGLPASGKSSIAKEFINKGYTILSRDIYGKKVKDLLPKYKQLLQEKKDIVVDNTSITVESRAAFISLAKEFKVPIHCHHLLTSFDDCQFNACQRMYDKYGKILDNEEIKQVKDPNTFPIAALFVARKKFQEPSMDEGFSSFVRHDFIRKFPDTFINAGLILDYDGTLRDTINGDLYPTSTDNIKILQNRKERLTEFVKKGYILAGMSNQSGVHKGILTKEKAIECFEFTNKLLGHNIDYMFCPHNSQPPFCWERKPYVGNAVALVMKYFLNPNYTIFVGDLHTDEKLAKSANFNYISAEEFFK